MLLPAANATAYKAPYFVSIHYFYNRTRGFQTSTLVTNYSVVNTSSSMPIMFKYYIPSVPVNRWASEDSWS